jgi:hypothetical protein
MERLTERLKSYWSAIGATMRPGVDHSMIASFEAHYGVRIPEDFCDYIANIDGIDDGNWDNEMISFWPLHSIKSVPEALTPFAGIPNYSQITHRLGEAGAYFVFADFLIWSHVYAVRFGKRESDKSQVLWICGSTYYSVAESFSDFLQMYLDKPESIVFPKR